MVSIEEYVLNKKLLIKEEIKSFERPLKLVIIQINDDPASNSYIKGKIKDLMEVNIRYELVKLSKDIKEEDLFKIIDNFNKDMTLDGLLVQMPLPPQIDEEKVKLRVSPRIDVDGFHPLSKFVSCTPKGIVTFLEDNNFEFKGKNAVILGRSNIVGKPMAHELLNRDMNVTVLHSKTSEEDRKFYLKHADLVIVSIGKPMIIDEKYEFKESAYIFDVGISRIDGKLVGDCKPNLPVFFQSPVPRGVGLLTRLALILNIKEGRNNGF